MNSSPQTIPDTHPPEASGGEAPAEQTNTEAPDRLRLLLDAIRYDSNIGKAHSFSKVLAKEHGPQAAILLKYIAYRSRNSTNIREDRQWHYESIDDLAERYPYLSASAIHQTLRRLVPSVLIRSNFNKRRADKTCWYAFVSMEVAASAERNLLYFDPGHAKAYGIPEALVLHNIRYWLRKHAEKDPKCNLHRTSPTELAKVLPLSRATIARALTNLVDAGAIAKNSSPAGKMPEFSSPGVPMLGMSVECAIRGQAVRSSNQDPSRSIP